MNGLKNAFYFLLLLLAVFLIRRKNSEPASSPEFIDTGTAPSLVERGIQEAIDLDPQLRLQPPPGIEEEDPFPMGPVSLTP